MTWVLPSIAHESCLRHKMAYFFSLISPYVGGVIQRPDGDYSRARG